MFEISHLTIVLAAVLVTWANAQVILHDHFDAPAVSGWIGQGNIRTLPAQNITQNGSVLTSEVITTQSNTNRRIVSTALFHHAETGGFRITFVADSISQAPAANVDLPTWSQLSSHTGSGQDLEASLNLSLLDLEDDSQVFLRVSASPTP